MLTYIEIKNFKKFPKVEFELGNRVVLVGPNNSGKTSALQALAMWDIGLRKWIEKRGIDDVPKKRPGVTINRRDLIAVPIPNSNLLWRNLHVRASGHGQGTQNVRIEITVKGITGGKEWICGLEFDYANEEYFFCRPLRINDNEERMPIPDQAKDIDIAFLQPMSGLFSVETRLDIGAIKVRLGEGRTAEVLRNLCYLIREGQNGSDRWKELVNRIKHLFGVKLEEPVYIAERGEITLAYRDRDGQTKLDISSSGRGLQQILLLLAHMMVNPGAILLLDEPDAHLEILRQRQIYKILSDIAEENNNQIIAASHSEVLLNEAADRDIVIAFLGKPHRIDDRGHQVRKSLKEFGYEQYYQAEETGWVLYLEGSTDLAILQAFAKKLNHLAEQYLERPFVYYVQDKPIKAQEHFHALREAKSSLVGMAIYDKLERNLPPDNYLSQYMWERREIENYLCKPEILISWARDTGTKLNGPLFAQQWELGMRESITEVEQALSILGKDSPWGPNLKVTDEFLDPLFEKFFKKMNLLNLMRKTDYHTLAQFVTKQDIEQEIIDVLSLIETTAKKAVPSEIY